MFYNTLSVVLAEKHNLKNPTIEPDHICCKHIIIILEFKIKQ